MTKLDFISLKLYKQCMCFKCTKSKENYSQSDIGKWLSENCSSRLRFFIHSVNLKKLISFKFLTYHLKRQSKVVNPHPSPILLLIPYLQPLHYLTLLWFNRPNLTKIKSLLKVLEEKNRLLLAKRISHDFFLKSWVINYQHYLTKNSKFYHLHTSFIKFWITTL